MTSKFLTGLPFSTALIWLISRRVSSLELSLHPDMSFYFLLDYICAKFALYRQPIGSIRLKLLLFCLLPAILYLQSSCCLRSTWFIQSP